MGLMVLLLAVTGSFVWLAVVSTLARMVVYSISIAALPRVSEQGANRPLIYAMMVAGIAVCVWAAFQSELQSWVTLAALVAAGTVLYLTNRSRRREARPE
jgi:heme exporter protein D